MTTAYHIAVLLVITNICMSTSWADGIPVDKVYHPNILANERKFEWRLVSRQNDNGNLLAQRFAYGQAISENIILEGYIVGERDELGDFGLQAYELEARWMLSNQGELWADWGALLEVEKQHADNTFELTTGLLFEKEYTRTSLTINALLVYEWGDSVNNEFETEVRLKYRYRFTPAFQPAIEIYTGEDFVGIGPAFMGLYRYQGQKQLNWEMAFIAGLNGDSKDHTLRFAIEYEF